MKVSIFSIHVISSWRHWFYVLKISLTTIQDQIVMRDLMVSTPIRHSKFTPSKILKPLQHLQAYGERHLSCICQKCLKSWYPSNFPLSKLCTVWQFSIITHIYRQLMIIQLPFPSKFIKLYLYIASVRVYACKEFSVYCSIT